MRQLKSVFVLAACVSFASATAVERWVSSSVDTTTVHRNTSTGSGKMAVGAVSTGPSGYGLHAVSTGSGGIGVWGQGPNHGVIGISGNSGVQGNTYATGGKGVAGYVDASVQATGVYGQARSGYGVHGVVNGMSPTGSEFVGVYGQATGNNGTGVKGRGHGTGSGVIGEAQGGGTAIQGSVEINGIGVRGYVESSTGTFTAGVMGVVDGGWDNFGVYGYAASYNSVGVYGEVLVTMHWPEALLATCMWMVAFMPQIL